MNRNLIRLIVVIVALFHVAPVFAESNYLGASVVLKKLAESSEQTGKTNEPPNDEALLKTDLESFQKNASALEPKEAAKKWLSFLERLDKVTVGRRYGSGSTLTTRELVAALPPPSAWDELARLIEARPPAKGSKQGREIGLRLFAHTLLKNKEAQKQDVAAFETLLKDLNRDQAMRFSGALQQLRKLQMENSDDPDAMIKASERELNDKENRYNRELEVPDLVSLVGKEKAKAFLRLALTNTTRELKIRNAEETEKLARQLALESVEQLKVAPWSLTHSLDATDLYEALDKRFGQVADKPENGDVLIDARYDVDNSRQEARAYYLLGLIVGNRNKEAVALVKKLEKEGRFYLPHDALKSLERAGHTRAIHDFFREMLVQDPEAPFWDEYIQLAAKVGETRKMLELARATAAREDLSNNRKSSIRGNLYRALLAANEIDEGVKELRQSIAGQTSKNSSADNYQPSSYGVTLARLGTLLEHADWVDEGIVAAKRELKEQRGENQYLSSYSALSLAKLLAELKRGPEAEAVLLDALVKETKKNKANYWDRESSRSVLIALAELYHGAGRHADVLTLLEESPDWQAKDLAEFFDDSTGGRYYGGGRHASPDPVGYYVASALMAQNRKPEAHKIIDAVLNEQGGFDPGYELLLQMDGDSAVVQLDKIYARDQFEERPVIWKAILMQRSGKLEEAEALARKAISIDPSDGEQGPGRRMRAYAVLADIREARGDKTQAEFFRGAVKAIRLSETADRYYEAGLLKKAVSMYQDSLVLFSDAYCIQSRLALRMTELGMHDQAEEHYRRAYELMPESFGRVESHCFGCEQAFDGQRAQSIAEKVFTSLATKTPNKPQVHYLLGYLREEQGRYKEALEHFRKAVQLDPDYLNAWAHIESVGSSARLPEADRDAVTLNLIRLDPLSHHHGRSADVTDLRALWEALEKAEQVKPPKVVSLYPLPASKQKMEKQDAANKESTYFYSVSKPETSLTPGMVIQNHQWISIATSLFGSEYAVYED